MPIEERTLVDIREEMARLAMDDRYTVTEVAQLFGVSRPTVRLWRERWRQQGREGLVDRSHAPLSCPHRTDGEIEQMIVEERRRWAFGSKKILQRLRDAYPDLILPRRSTVDAIFVRHDLAQRQRRRRSKSRTPFAHRYAACEPGEVNTIDHKGQFRLRSGRYCYPLTMMDTVSRYILACEALDSTSFERAWPVIVRVFRDNGLPRAMHSDNGPPFGAPNGTFSRMSVELMRLDVQPVFSRPGVPQDNGRHERMHRDLKASIVSHRSASFAEQQQQFDVFRDIYNRERPHEGIDMKRPADVYRPSPRPYPSRRPKPQYELHWEKRKISETGIFRWKNDPIFLGHAFAGETVSFEATDVDLWTIRFFNFVIGKFDERSGTLV